VPASTLGQGGKYVWHCPFTHFADAHELEPSEQSWQTAGTAHWAAEVQPPPVEPPVPEGLQPVGQHCPAGVYGSCPGGHCLSTGQL
jgi:hypothetical protein